MARPNDGNPFSRLAVRHEIRRDVTAKVYICLRGAHIQRSSAWHAREYASVTAPPYPICIKQYKVDARIRAGSRLRSRWVSAAMSARRHFAAVPLLEEISRQARRDEIEFAPARAYVYRIIRLEFKYCVPQSFRGSSLIILETERSNKPIYYSALADGYHIMTRRVRVRGLIRGVFEASRAIRRSYILKIPATRILMVTVVLLCMCLDTTQTTRCGSFPSRRPTMH